MTAGEVISRVDELEPNQFSSCRKKQWLSILDGQLAKELAQSFRIEGLEDRLPISYTALTDELLLPSPYGEQIYNFYLQAMFASENGESGKYNRAIQQFNSAWQQYINYVNRTTEPRAAKNGNRFRF